MKNYGQAIKALRKRADMTQSELAKNLNVTYQTVSKWETGINTPDISVIESMCALFGVGVEEFLRLANEETESTAESEARAQAPVKEDRATVHDEIVHDEVAPAGGERTAARKKLAVKPLYIVLAAIVGVAIILTAVLVPVLLLREKSPLTASELYDKVSPSVFCVECVTAKGTEEGSGFFIDDDGTAVVDANVIFGAWSASVRLHDGSTHAIDKVLGRDIDRGLAIVHVNVERSVPVKLSSGGVKTGKDVYVVGYFERFSLGSKSAIRDGVVSKSAYSIDGIDYIKTTVEASSVCRGGVLADEFGSVIGVVKYGMFDSGNTRNDVAVPISAILTIRLNLDMTLDEYTEKYGRTVAVTYSLYGTPLLKAELAIGERVPQIDFVADGVELLGWYADPEFTTPFDFSIRPEESTTLYAKCAFDEYTVRFVGGDGAKGYMQDITAEKGKGFTLPENRFTKTGYTFSGWKVGGTTYQEGEAVADQSGPIVTVEAVWTPVRYNVRFACGDDGFTVSYTYGEKHFAPSTVYERVGYTHDGWRVGDTVYKKGETIPDLASENGATVTVAAEMTPISYTMQIDLNATGDVYVDGDRYNNYWKYAYVTCHYGEDPFEAHSFSRDYMDIESVTVFDENDDPYEGDLRYVNSDPNRMVKAKLFWVSGRYTLEVYGTDKRNTVRKVVLTGREEYTLPTASYLLERNANFTIEDGYRFMYWGLGSSTSKTTFGDGATVSDLLKYDYITTSGNSVAVRLFPVMDPISYIVAFDGNGGSGSTADIACIYDEEYALPECGFTCDGYVFGGWQFGDKKYVAGAKIKNLTTEEQTLTFTAQWKNLYDGNGTEEDPYRIGTYAELKDLYDFVKYVDGMNDAYYVLTADIDCEGGELNAVGDVTRRFNGTFDGQSHVIENALFAATGTYKGLFGYVYDGQIKNVGIINYSFGTINHGDYLAPLVCKYYSTKPISSCFAEGEVEITDVAVVKASGLVGELCGEMINCYSHCGFSASYNVSGMSSPHSWYNGGIYYGGLVIELKTPCTFSPTWADGSTGPLLYLDNVGLYNCYSYGDVDVNIDPEIEYYNVSQQVGLLIAYANWGARSNKVEGCFTAGKITCNIDADAYESFARPHSRDTGKVAGEASAYDDTFTDVYTSVEMTYGDAAFDGTALPGIADMEDSSLRSLSWLKENLGFDDSVWTESADGYPTLAAYSKDVE